MIATSWMISFCFAESCLEERKELILNCYDQFRDRLVGLANIREIRSDFSNELKLVEQISRKRISGIPGSIVPKKTKLVRQINPPNFNALKPPLEQNGSPGTFKELFRTVAYNILYNPQQKR